MRATTGYTSTFVSYEKRPALLHPAIPKNDDEQFIIRYIFEVLRGVLDLLGRIETQLMPEAWAQVFNAKEVTEVESAMDEMIQKVFHVVLAKKQFIDQNEMSKELRYLRTLIQELLNSESDLFVNEAPPIPDLSPFFVGRKRGLNDMKGVLIEYGTAAITQFGGVGRTQLMVAFVEQFQSDFPSGVHWISFPVNESLLKDNHAYDPESSSSPSDPSLSISDDTQYASLFLETIASYVEKRFGIKSTKKDRKNAKIVISQSFYKSDGCSFCV